MRMMYERSFRSVTTDQEESRAALFFMRLGWLKQWASGIYGTQLYDVERNGWRITHKHSFPPKMLHRWLRFYALVELCLNQSGNAK